jgi:hypothetical protein
MILPRGPLRDHRAHVTSDEERGAYQAPRSFVDLG